MAAKVLVAPGSSLFLIKLQCALKVQVKARATAKAATADMNLVSMSLFVSPYVPLVWSQNSFLSPGLPHCFGNWQPP